jgi:Ca2+-binding RTX toxin-like protein
LSILLAGTMAAYAAANTVPPTRMDEDDLAVSANDLKPSACAGLNLTNTVVGSGSIDGTAASDLILGSAGADTLRGRQGNDCILGGDGGDSLQGDQGGDVLLAGGGDDALIGGAGTDVCDGESGIDTGHPTCETQVDIP